MTPARFLAVTCPAWAAIGGAIAFYTGQVGPLIGGLIGLFVAAASWTAAERTMRLPREDHSYPRPPAGNEINYPGPTYGRSTTRKRKTINHPTRHTNPTQHARTPHDRRQRGCDGRSAA